MINHDGAHMISHKMIEYSVIQNLELVFTSDNYEGLSTLSVGTCQGSILDSNLF